MNIQLYNGDCMKIMKDIPDKSIDCLITDPPYKFKSQGGGFCAKNKSTHRVYADSLKKINCCDFNAVEFLDMVKPKLKKFYAYLFCNKTLVADYLNYAIKNKYIYDILIMGKSNPIPSYNNHYLSDLEYVIVMRESGTYFSKEKNIDNFRKWYLTSCKKGVHPAQKPVELLKRFVCVSTKENDIVLDPFIGSGSTGVACKSLNRNFIGIEIDKNYFEIAKNRIEETKE